jgi:hypothetical protein
MEVVVLNLELDAVDLEAVLELLIRQWNLSLVLVVAFENVIVILLELSGRASA